MSWRRCAACDKSQGRGKLISCLHCLCLECVEGNIEFDGSIHCPACGQKTTAKPGQSLLLSLPDAYPEPKLGSEPSVELEGCMACDLLLCDECAESSLALSTCQDCSLNLCEAHAKAHPLFRRTLNHSITPLAKSSPAAGTGTVAVGTAHPASCVSACRQCAVHPSHNVSRFCLSCDCLLCNQCMLRSTHLQHRDSVLSIDEAAAKMRVAVSENLSSLSSSSAGSSLASTLEKVKGAICRLNEDTEGASKKVTDYCEKVLESVKRREKELLDELDKVRSVKLLPLEKQYRHLESTLAQAKALSSIMGSCDNSVDFLRVRGWLDNAVAAQRSIAEEIKEPCASGVPWFIGGNTSQLDEELDSCACVVDLKELCLSCPEEITLGTDEEAVTVEVCGGGLSARLLQALPVSVEVASPDNTPVAGTPMSASSTGGICSAFQPTCQGAHIVSVCVAGVHLPGSPVTVCAMSAHTVFDTMKCHSEMHLSNADRTVTKMGRKGYTSVCSRPATPVSDKVTWRVRVDEVGGYEPSMYICASNSTRPALDRYHQRKTEMFGWRGDYTTMYVYPESGDLGQRWQRDDVIKLTWDVVQQTLTGHHERAGATDVHHGVTGSLYLYISLYVPGHQVTILP